jgi:hypothetical protein
VFSSYKLEGNFEMKTKLRSQTKCRMIVLRRLALTINGIVLVMASMASAQDTTGINADFLRRRPYSPYADRAFLTDVYFGDTHVHTSISADAGGGGTAGEARASL